MSETTSAIQSILLVEDDEDTRYVMRLELEQRGFHIVEAEDGEKGVELARRVCPDIILMDISLPGMDGLAATKEIRKDERTSRIPVVAVTAHQETDFREGAKESGFDAYVTKPIDFDWLCELLAGLIV